MSGCRPGLILLFAAALLGSATTAALPAEARQDSGSAGQSNNEVLIIGSRPEVRYGRAAGQSTTITPEDATRFNTTSQLKQDSALTVPESGRMTASGFAVPRIRGQDARLTEVYLDDLLLQNPYSGLPLVDDLDLRAFGELQLYQGTSPPELASLNPIGVMQYRFRPVSQHNLTLGVSYGKPHGATGWALTSGKIKTAGAGSFTYRLYLREHKTDGRYSYYYDNATPYNVKDDTYRTRENNDRTARQALPVLTYEQGRDKLQLVTLWQDASAGIPPSNPLSAQSTASHPHEQRKVQLAALSWRHRFFSPDAYSPALLPDFVTLSASQHVMTNAADDPTATIVGSAASGHFRVKAQRFALAPAWQNSGWQLFSNLASDDATVNNTAANGSNLDVRRTAASFYLGLGLATFSDFALEAKTSGRLMRDQFHTNGNSDVLVPTAASRSSSHHYTSGKALSIASDLTPFIIYLQVAYQERAASLLEQFGDGGIVHANANVAPEATAHSEAGIAWRPEQQPWSTHLALFQDDTKDKIVFVPTIQQGMRAENITKTQVRGVDLHADWSSSATTLLAGYTRLWPYDMTSSSRHYLLPGVSEQTAVASLSQKLAWLTLRWTSRYRSPSYRDHQNLIVIPAYTVHDASLDSTFRLGANKLQCGLSVLNVFNTMKLPIAARDTPASRGATSYSDVEGEPLPGRQWLATLVSQWQ